MELHFSLEIVVQSPGSGDSKMLPASSVPSIFNILPSRLLSYGRFLQYILAWSTRHTHNCAFLYRFLMHSCPNVYLFTIVFQALTVAERVERSPPMLKRHHEHRIYQELSLFTQQWMETWLSSGLGRVKADTIASWYLNRPYITESRSWEYLGTLTSPIGRKFQTKRMKTRPETRALENYSPFLKFFKL